MIQISAHCQSCGATWKPRKVNGPERDYNAARRWADAHARRHPGHSASAMNTELTTTARGSTIKYLDLEITRR